MRQIITRAKALHQKYGLKGPDVIAERLGARIFEVLETQHVREVYFPSLKAIAIRPSLPHYERAYLLAHGLGHHILHASGLHRDFVHMHVKGVFGSLEWGRIEILRREREADLFACYLLIPDSQLQPLLDEDWVRESNDLVWQLAVEFEVPKELMRQRLEFEQLKRRHPLT
jgi:Zn-dependent peptidase ImmA (M78 family)